MITVWPEALGLTLERGVRIHGQGRCAPHPKTADSISPVLFIGLTKALQGGPPPGSVQHITDAPEFRSVVHRHVTAVRIGRGKSDEKRGTSATCCSNEDEDDEPRHHADANGA